MSIIKGSSHLPSSSLKIEDQDSPKKGIVSILGSDFETNKSASLRRTLSADMSSKKWLAQNGFGFSPMKKIASSEELTISNPTANHASSSSFSSPSSLEGEEEYDHHQPRTDDKEELIKSAPGQDDVWRSIQQQQSQQKPDGKWTWSSILYDKNEQSSKLPPAYIHPLVRRSGSSLSEKSLEICTESLGSETGSDGFSSYPPSEAGDAEEEKENDQQQQPQQFAQQQLSESYEDSPVVKYSYSYSKKMGPRSIPPPLPSLAREDGAAVHMQSHRENGRLVLEAVSVPSQNYFHARREDGRLRLSFVNNPSPSGGEGDEEVEELEQVFDNFEDMAANDEDNSSFDAQEEGSGGGYYSGFEEEEGEGEEEEEEDDDEGIEMEKGRREMEEFVFKHVSTPTLMVKKLMGLDKKNLATWSSRFNNKGGGGGGVNLLEVAASAAAVMVEAEEEDGRDPSHPTTNLPPLPLPQSLPAPTRVARLIPAPPATKAAAASFNAYEYFWREKPSMASIIKPVITTDEKRYSPNNKVILTFNLKGYEKQNLVLMRGNKAEYLVPLLRRCNESRRSLLLGEPHCISTS